MLVTARRLRGLGVGGRDAVKKGNVLAQEGVEEIGAQSEREAFAGERRCLGGQSESRRVLCNTHELSHKDAASRGRE
jgi:hypothetical protein